MKNTSIPRANNEDSDRENIQNRINNLFTDQDPPSYANLREVEAMRTRIQELEAELGKHPNSYGNSATPDKQIEPPGDQQITLQLPDWSLSKDSSSGTARESRSAMRLLNLLLGAVGISLPIYVYWAVKTGAWQIYAIFISLILICFIVRFGISLVRRNRVAAAMELMVATACCVIPFIVGLISGVGFVLAATLFLIVLAISGQSLSGSRATRALLAGFIFSIITLIVDLLANWPRLSVPGLQATIPLIALTLALVLSFMFVRQFQHYPLRSKLFIMFVAVALISIGAVSYVTNRITTEQFNKTVGASFNELANRMAREIGESILANKSAMDGLALNKFVQDSVEEANTIGTSNQSFMKFMDQQWATASDGDIVIQEVLDNPLAVELRELQQRLPQYAELFITDRYGAVIASTDRTTDYYQADEGWWQKAWNDGDGGVYISQPEYDESTGVYAIDIALPIPVHNQMNYVGVLRATVNVNELTSVLSAGQFGQTGQAVLVFPDNQFLTTEIGERLGVLDDQTALGISSMTGESSKLDYEGVASLVSTSPVGSLSSRNGDQVINDLGWTVVIHQSLDEADKPITTTTRAITLTSVFVLVLVGLLALLIGGQFARPVENLTMVAEELATGNLFATANDRSKDEVGRLANTFNSMAGRLRETLLGLEQRVADRTHDLELATEVGRAVSEKAGNLTDMLSRAVELIRSRYALYYTQIYLVDASGRNLILRAGTGEVGGHLLMRDHRLLISANSLNSRAASNRKPVLVGDTQRSGNFLPNPLLPLTRSELSVPLIANEAVLGVLDMQSDKPESFNESNLPAYLVLAGELAIAIQNSMLFGQAEDARQEVEEQARHLAGSGWQDFLNAVDRSERIGYVYNQEKVIPLAEAEESTFTNKLVLPFQILGVDVGEVQLADDDLRNWTSAENEIVKAAMQQVEQHIENLRLLAQAEQYREEAEQVSRRLTNEGWREFLQTRAELAAGYEYRQNAVQPLNSDEYISQIPAISYPLTVRDETIGEFLLESNIDSTASVSGVLAAVAGQLSDHIENLRLLESAEQKRLELETVATVSSTASTVLDPDYLLQSVVNLTKEQFGLYHAHIYLADDDLGALLLKAGAGEIGRNLVANGHSIPLTKEHSLVAQAARNKRAVIVNNVADEPDFLPNPLLPETRAELAVPMIVGESLLGVFDVQSNNTGGFTEEDANIYTTLAAQVAIALQNARLYVEQAATVTQLRELDRLKSSFLANMSHELRTPLNSILGFTDVMLEELDGPLTEFMDNDLRLIQKNGQHLLHLINDVLDMAKIESGRMNLNPEKFKVQSVLEEVMNITSTLASEKNVSLYIDEDSDTEIEIFADNTRLRQVMINLVNNSIKFTENGKISLLTRPLDGARVKITVRDTGIGIPPDKLESIFQEFTQVDSSTTRKAGGTGLGLPISRRLVEMHGGRLWAESTGIPGEGATFQVELPVEARITEVLEKQEKPDVIS